MKKLCLVGTMVCIAFSTLVAQYDWSADYHFTHADTLRGALRPERTAYDVTYYALDVSFDIMNQSISGFCTIQFDLLHKQDRLQVDLFENMAVDSIQYDGELLTYTRDGNAIFVDSKSIPKGDSRRLTIYYHGAPIVGKRLPWDGGFTWTKDDKGRDWVGVACEGTGASLWWPNKDHLSDEPDSVRMTYRVPSTVMAVGNGQLESITPSDDITAYTYFVSYPINNYNVTVNIGDYVHWDDAYVSSTGDSLTLNYYVIAENLERSKKHFEQVKPMLACYEQYLGPYPFWEDGFALVETPYLGMEHQSGIAYGNGYMRGYLGGMIPAHMNWDYIIIHEAGHEYFGNAVSCNDLAEMWIHESFTTYLESVYVECLMGYEEAENYLVSQRGNILNRQPVRGPEGVNWDHWQGSDHYYKGAWMLHTLRHQIDNDELWWKILKTFYQEHSIGHATTQDWIDHLREMTGQDYAAFTHQYLDYAAIPVVEIRSKIKGKKTIAQVRLRTNVPELTLHVGVGPEGQMEDQLLSNEWKTLVYKSREAVKVDYKKCLVGVRHIN